MSLPMLNLAKVPTTTKEELQQERHALSEKRLSICRGCDRRQDFPRGLLRCKECGCLMNMKVAIVGQKCPLGKW